MVNFKTDVSMVTSDGREGSAVVLTHELFGYPNSFIGYVGDDWVARRVVAWFRRRGVTGRCPSISEEEALKYYPQPAPLSELTEVMKPVRIPYKR